MERARRLAVILVLVVLAAAALPAAEPLRAIKAGRVIDPSTGTSRPGLIILIEGRFIKAVGPDVKIPKDAEVIDLAGQSVLPGLMDCHTHVCEMISGAGGFQMTVRSHYLVDTTLDRALQGVANLRS